jgi:aminoglycoside/choline kinase family phosphotransferase
MTDILSKFEPLFKQFSSEKITEVKLLPQSGSNRKYYRIFTSSDTFIGTEGADKHENNAFINLASHFISKGIAVPNLLAVSSDRMFYIQEDLGEVSLYQYLPEVGSTHSPELKHYYEKAIDLLISIHTLGSQSLDYSVCYPSAEFDALSIQWDLEYFKYYFLKLNDLPYDEHALQDELNLLRDKAAEVKRSCFMIRDFQSRNIMLNNDQPVLIDFQGGRLGPYQYDLVSLLWQAKAKLPNAWRLELKERYVDGLKAFVSVEEEQFSKDYWLFVLIRTMQVLGAYGLRGIVQGKAHFINSIPLALENLNYLFSEKAEFLPDLPQIRQAVEHYSNKKI